jgi:ferrous iron transport protein A
MKSGERGTVLAIQGGHGLARRLNSLGVRPGKRVSKVGSMFMRGPVTIQIDNTQIALGFGMADKVVVELDSK